MNNYRLILYFITILILSCGTPPCGWEGSDDTNCQDVAIECTVGVTADCEGVCGGTATIDCEGVCNGSAGTADCEGVCGGTATIDCEGVCNGPGTLYSNEATMEDTCCPSGQTSECYCDGMAMPETICYPAECWCD